MMDYDVYMHDLLGLVIILEKAQGHTKRSLDEYRVAFWMLEDLPVVPYREVYLSTSGFILHHWTVMFLFIILQCSSF